MIYTKCTAASFSDSPPQSKKIYIFTLRAHFNSSQEVECLCWFDCYKTSSTEKFNKPKDFLKDPEVKIKHGLIAGRDTRRHFKRGMLKFTAVYAKYDAIFSILNWFDHFNQTKCIIKWCKVARDETHVPKTTDAHSVLSLDKLYANETSQDQPQSRYVNYVIVKLHRVGDNYNIFKKRIQTG